MKLPNIKLFNVWQPVLYWAIGVLTAATLLLIKLESLLPGFSRPEIITKSLSVSAKAIGQNPINAQYRLIVYGLKQLGHQGPVSLRLVSVLFAAVAVWLFYYVVSSWYERRIAVIGTILFTTSAWFLHYARLATPDITLTLLLAAIAYGHWIRHTKNFVLAGFAGALLAVWLMYIPGLIWFVILGGIWQRKQITALLKNSKFSIPFIVLIVAGLLTPLVLSIIREPNLIKTLVGLPAIGLLNPYEYIRHVVNVPVQLFIHGPDNPVIWLGRLPLLDILAITMFIMGAYSCYYKRQLDRIKFLVATIIIGSFLIGLRGGVSMIILMPFIYIFITAGLGYFLDQWLSVFPRNPFARIIGIGLVFALITLSVAYNLKHYFVAWPQAPATKSAFRLKI